MLDAIASIRLMVLLFIDLIDYNIQFCSVFPVKIHINVKKEITYHDFTSYQATQSFLIACLQLLLMMHSFTILLQFYLIVPYLHILVWWRRPSIHVLIKLETWLEKFEDKSSTLVIRSSFATITVQISGWYWIFDIPYSSL